jgi:hypothetical protein
LGKVGRREKERVRDSGERSLLEGDVACIAAAAEEEEEGPMVMAEVGGGAAGVLGML